MKVEINFELYTENANGDKKYEVKFITLGIYQKEEDKSILLFNEETDLLLKTKITMYKNGLISVERFNEYSIKMLFEKNKTTTVKFYIDKNNCVLMKNKTLYLKNTNQELSIIYETECDVLEEVKHHFCLKYKFV